MAVTGENQYFSKFPPGYINGLLVSRASNTTLSIATGSCRDSTNAAGMTVGSTLTVNFAITGAGGLDTGSIAATTMYNVFVIGDSTGKLAVAGFVSTSATPTLPTGYDMIRQVGFWPTNGSSQLIVGYCTGSCNFREFMYDAIQATAVTAGAATSYTAVDLSNIVPAVAGTWAFLYAALTPNAAGDTAKFRPSGGTGDSHILTAVVATKINDGQFMLPILLVSSAPKIDYKVTSASDSLAISVEGFQYFL